MIISFSLDGETPPYWGTCWDISKDTITPTGMFEALNPIQRVMSLHSHSMISKNKTGFVDILYHFDRSNILQKYQGSRTGIRKVIRSKRWLETR